MTAIEPTMKRTRAALFGALVVLLVLPLLSNGLPPLTDLPGHVARWYIATTGPTSPLAAYYAVDWSWIGNLGADVIAALLLPLIGPAATAEVILVLIVLISAAGIAWLSREAHGRIAPTALFALPFIYGWPFQMGFVNFAFAQGLALCAFALWLRLARAGRLERQAFLFVPIGLILWTVHSAGWGLLGLMVFGAELQQLRAAGRSWRASIGGTLVACLPLALPVLIMVFSDGRDARGAETGDWFNMLAKFLWLLSSLRDRWMWFDIGALGPPLLLLYIAARDPRLGFSSQLGWSALACLIGFLLLPRLLLGGSYVDMRMVPIIWILAILAIRPPPPGRFANAIAIAGLIFVAARMVGATISFEQRRNEQRAELGAVARIPRGAPVLALVFKPCMTPWSDIRPEHLPAFAILRRDAFVNEQWAIGGQQYLRVLYTKAAPFTADPSQLVYPRSCADQGRAMAAVLNDFPRDAFSHVWIIGKALPRPRDFGLVTVWTNGRSELYEVIGTAGRGRVDRRP